MQKHFITLLALLVSGAAWAQVCPQPNAATSFHINQVYTYLRNNGSLFHDGNSNRYTVYDINGRIPSLLGATALRMGYTDTQGNIHLAAGTYPSTQYDFSAGPLIPNTTGAPPTAICTNFNRFWSVRGIDIDPLKSDYADNGVVNDTPAASIMGFPCRNNPYFEQINGFALPPNHDFASFRDRNNDSIYDPMQGDYPIVPNTDSLIADLLSWCIFNDYGNGASHTVSAALPIKAEVQQTFYAWVSNDYLHRTTFASYKITNYSGENLPNFYAGLWSDMDLGCDSDDYIGTIPSLNTIYAYDGDNNDNLFCPSGAVGFGPNTPAQAIVFMNKTLDNSTYFRYGNDPKQGSPTTATEYLSHLQGKWRDGTPYYPCGDASIPCSANPITTKFVFPNAPLDNWSMLTSALPSNDYKVNGSFYTPIFYNNQAINFDVAFFTTTMQNVSYANADEVYRDVPKILDRYDNDFDYGCTVNCVYPGDTNNDGTINHLDFLYLGCSWNSIGTPRRVKSYLFDLIKPKYSQPWQQPNLANNLNRKYQDCNGDGKVSYSDIEIIKVNRDTTFLGAAPITYSPANSALTLESNTPLLENLDSIPQNLTTLNIPLKIRLNGDANGQVQDFYGVAFSVDVPDSLFYMIINSNTLFSVDTSIYLINFIARTRPGAINIKGLDVAIVRKDGQNFTGNAFDLMTFRIRRTTSILYNQSIGCARFSKVRMINKDGTTLPYGAEDQCMFFTSSTTVLANENATTLKFECYPNPAQNELTLVKPTDNLAKMTITDLAGRTVLTQLLTQNTSVIDTQTLQNGVYLITITENGSRAVQKIVVLH